MKLLRWLFKHQYSWLDLLIIVVFSCLQLTGWAMLAGFLGLLLWFFFANVIEQTLEKYNEN